MSMESKEYYIIYDFKGPKWMGCFVSNKYYELNLTGLEWKRDTYWKDANHISTRWTTKKVNEKYLKLNGIPICVV